MFLTGVVEGTSVELSFMQTKNKVMLMSIGPDGEKPKRRGPKPDSKPALTRRQELNRQAQRYVHLPSVVDLA